jgi:transposase
MIRIDCIWLALSASDLRGGIDKLLAQVVHGFALGAQAHHAYVFANRRGDRLKVPVFDGVGMWLCTRRLQLGSFEWPREDTGSLALSREQFDWLVAAPAVATSECATAAVHHGGLTGSIRPCLFCVCPWGKVPLRARVRAR